MKNTNESGRSMVEMLGVLAIIGVLSIGGIAGYTMAMNKYRSNAIVNAIIQAAIDCRTRNKIADEITDGVEGISNVRCANKHTGAIGFTLNATSSNEKAIAKMVCKSLDASTGVDGSTKFECNNDAEIVKEMFYKPQS